MSDPSPLISIILPTHNGAEFIAESIDSVIAQSDPHWELIICDDGSTDDTAAVVAPYLSDPRVRYFLLEKQKSVYRVRNIAISHATGELLAFLDADDLYSTEALAVLRNALDEHPQWGAVYGFFTCMNEKGEPVANHGVNLFEREDGILTIPVRSQHTWKNILEGRCISILQNIMVRRAFFEAVGPFYEEATHAFDVQYIIRLFMMGFDQIGPVPRYTVRYRIHNKGITKNPKLLPQLIESRLAVVRWLYSQDTLPLELEQMKSFYYLLTYMRLARLQLFEGRSLKVLMIFKMALFNPNVNSLSCLMQFAPLLVLAAVPNNLYKAIFNTAKNTMNFYSHLLTKKHQAVRPA